MKSHLWDGVLPNDPYADDAVIWCRKIGKFILALIIMLNLAITGWLPRVVEYYGLWRWR